MRYEVRLALPGNYAGVHALVDSGHVVTKTRTKFGAKLAQQRAALELALNTDWIGQPVIFDRRSGEYI